MVIKKLFTPLAALWGTHDRAILTGVSIVGTIAAVAIAIKDRPKYEEILWECEDEGCTKVETAGALTKASVPLMIAVGTSVGAALWNHFRTGKKITSLTDTAASALNTYMVTKAIKDEYDKRYGPEVANDVEKSVAERRAAKSWADGGGTPSMVVSTGHGKELFYDELFGLWIEGSWNWFEKCANDADRDIRTEMWIAAYEVYLNFGVPASRIPEVTKELGWNVDDGPIELQSPECEFDEETGKPYGIIRWRTKPIYKYERRRY